MTAPSEQSFRQALVEAARKLQSLQAENDRLRGELQRQSEHEASQPTAVRLHPDPPLAPIFAVGGALGGTAYFRDIARALGPLQPFYAMHFPGSDDDAPPLERIEDLAEDFVRQGRAVHPGGPWVLLGHSFGGIVVLEMAQQLVAMGESVLEVLLLDAWTVSKMAGGSFDKHHAPIAELLAPFIAAGVAAEELQAQTPRFERLWRANGTAAEAYVMRPFDGDMTLILPEEDLLGTTASIAEWRSLCPSLKTRRTAGDHTTMALPPHCSRTAHVIRSLLQQ